jgi:UDP-N-acetylmuramyl pentapeptide synthase
VYTLKTVYGELFEQDEIKRTTKEGQPRIGVVLLNYGSKHLEGVGGNKDAKFAKRSLIDFADSTLTFPRIDGHT